MAHSNMDLIYSKSTDQVHEPTFGGGFFLEEFLTYTAW